MIFGLRVQDVWRDGVVGKRERPETMLMKREDGVVRSKEDGLQPTFALGRVRGKGIGRLVYERMARRIITRFGFGVRTGYQNRDRGYC